MAQPPLNRPRKTRAVTFLYALRIIPYMKTRLIIGAVILLIIALLSWRFIFPSSSPTSAVMQPAPLAVDPSTLPGIQNTPAPWTVELSQLKERLTAIGLAALSEEGAALHIHQHLDIFINGTPVAVPSGIGVNQAAGFISPVHVHDTTGVIHVESPMIRDFTLGELFDVWGVRFTKDCIGSYCADTTNTISLYVNGTLATSTDPRDLLLTAHQEIAIVYGSTTPATIPSSFDFPAGE